MNPRSTAACEANIKRFKLVVHLPIFEIALRRFVGLVKVAPFAFGAQAKDDQQGRDDDSLEKR